MLRLLTAATNYKGTSFSLPDAELDAQSVADALDPYCERVMTTIGRRATREGVLSAIRAFCATLRAGDLGLAYFSGHGTVDSLKGKKVQAIVCHDGQLIYDFELHAEFAKRSKKSLLASLADCCHSGGLMRGLAQLNHGKPKTIHVSSAIRPKVALPTRAPDLPDAKFTACEASEVAFSTGHGGAMTLAFLEAFAEREADTTLPALHKAIRQRLPSIDWAQTPQFSCDSALRKRTLRSFMRGAA